ncbi:MAG: DUF952 domain-containing protein [Pseudomonadota bacterium]
MKQTIYTMVRTADWAVAKTNGRYDGSADDRADGFLHFSAADQLRESARRHRAGETDLLLVAVDAEALGDALKWERAPSRGADFPHLYASLDLSHVISVTPLPLDPDGLHRFPDIIPD